MISDLGSEPYVVQGWGRMKEAFPHVTFVRDVAGAQRRAEQ